MAELEEKLSAILGNPEAMDQIISIAKTLTGGGEESGPAPDGGDGPPPEAPSGDPEPGGADATPDWSALLGLLGGGGGDSPLSLLDGLDPKLLEGALTLFAQYSAADDQRVALLSALRPFLREERRGKVDRAIQIARLSRLIRAALRLFSKEGGQKDV